MFSTEADGKAIPRRPAAQGLDHRGQQVARAKVVEDAHGR